MFTILYGLYTRTAVPGVQKYTSAPHDVRQYFLYEPVARTCSRCCTNLLNDFSYEIFQTPVQAKTTASHRHTGDHMKG